MRNRQNLYYLCALTFALTGCFSKETEQFYAALPEKEESGGGDASSLSSPGGSNITTSDICVANPSAPACNMTPAVTTPGVVTILFTMQQIPQGSASLILNNAIKYASPIVNPKILFLKDTNTNGEDEGDVLYIKDSLLGDYDVSYAEIPAAGLAANSALLTGKDLVIVSNPGYPLSSQVTFNTLKGFAGGVILMGDDLAHSSGGYNMNSLTGLNFIENGTQMSCNGQTYYYDNLAAHLYQVAMDEIFLPGIPAQYKNFQYGNDIDRVSVVAGVGVQILALSSPEAGTCPLAPSPAIARKPKN